MLLGFKKQFVEPIILGTKIHTLRTQPKRTPKIGESLHMFTGLRTKYCELITKKEILMSTQEVVIQIHCERPQTWGKISSTFWLFKLIVIIDKKRLRHNDLVEFCINDGFENGREFCQFFLDVALKNDKLIKDNLVVKIEGPMTLFHWTKLKY